MFSGGRDWLGQHREFVPAHPQLVHDQGFRHPGSTGSGELPPLLCLEQKLCLPQEEPQRTRPSRAHLVLDDIARLIRQGPGPAPDRPPLCRASQPVRPQVNRRFRARTGLAPRLLDRAGPDRGAPGAC